MAETSATAPLNTSRGPSELKSAPDAKPLSEANILAHEAQAARAAIGSTLSEFAQTVKSVGDVTLWAKRYPMITTGTAAIAGFVASCLLVPSAKDQVAEKIAPHTNGHNGSRKHPAATTVDINGQEYELHPAAEKAQVPAKGMIAVIIAEIMKLLRPVMMEAVANYTASRRENTEDDSAQSDAAAQEPSPT